MRFIRCFLSEISKLLTVRGFLYALVGLIGIIIAGVYGFSVAARHGVIDSSSAFTMPLYYGQAAVILLGCWLLIEETDGGCLRTTFLAVPSRTNVVCAKTAVAFLVSFDVSTVTIVLSYCARMLALNQAISFRSLAGHILYWTILGTFAFSLSAVLRNGTVSLGIILGTAFLLSAFLRAYLPAARYLPDQLGTVLCSPSSTQSSFIEALGALVLWEISAFIGSLVSAQTWEVGS
ncbi:ABC-2 family transporter protein [Scardovia inopinata]|uniref:ABC-2 type transporter domain-containing protein n=2 Tax=Scardovia inopinata TaxID=78259 RepID=W5IGM3_SCAIO|nr:ABC transporter integral membrane protein [Scardovia inopinata]EFG25968.1 hypothetical protein HMPREF9020_01036 [Scardovia inopinata F0304]BAR07405.1 hypothetical protein SCIP_1338 [Scardovia inopinata JCM 12537]SUV51478.1 ABC-2 family transporter protein [Scardovia inopinata]